MSPTITLNLNEMFMILRRYYTIQRTKTKDLSKFEKKKNTFEKMRT